MQLHSEQLSGNLEISHKQAFRSGWALASVLPPHKHCEASRNTLENLCQQRTGASGFGWIEPTVQVWWPCQNSGWNLSGGLPTGPSSQQHQVGKKTPREILFASRILLQLFRFSSGLWKKSSFSSQGPQKSSGVLPFQDDHSQPRHTESRTDSRRHVEQPNVLRFDHICVRNRRDLQRRVPPEPGRSRQADDHRNHIVCKSARKPLIGRRHRPDVFIVSTGSDPKAAVHHGKSFTSASWGETSFNFGT